MKTEVTGETRNTLSCLRDKIPWISTSGSGMPGPAVRHLSFGLFALLLFVCGAEAGVAAVAAVKLHENSGRQ